MSWFKKPLRREDSIVSISFSITTPEQKFARGMPVYDEKIIGHRLDNRELNTIVNGKQESLTIDELRIKYYAGLLPPDGFVLVTNRKGDTIYYSGEGTVQQVVWEWESAELYESDKQHVREMIKGFSLPEYAVSSKAQYHDLKRLYDRCERYYRHINAHDEEFKRLTKIAARDLVFQLDSEEADWDFSEGERRFAEEVRKRLPQLLRSESEKKAKVKRDKETDLRNRERECLVETRNNLTNFPHKDMVIEVKDVGVFKMRDIKAAMREGQIAPESFVRYRVSSDWLELHDFLRDWMKRKVTVSQIDYLTALQQQHDIHEEIPLDALRSEISKRISALAPKREFE